MSSAGNRGMGASGQPATQRPGGTTGTGTAGAAASPSTSGAGVAGAVKERAQDLASSVARSAEDAWESTTEGVQRAASAVASTTGDAWQSVTECMSRYPLATFFTGLGVGFMLARAFGNAASFDYWRSSWQQRNPWERGTRYASEGPSHGGGQRFSEGGPVY